LGLAFLRHVERCQIIAHLIDGTSEDPVQDFLDVNLELAMFSEKLAKKPQVIVLTKMDIEDAREKKEEVIEKLKKASGHSRVIEISAVSHSRTKELMGRLSKLLTFLDTSLETSGGREVSEESASLLVKGSALSSLSEEEREAVKAVWEERPQKRTVLSTHAQQLSDGAAGLSVNLEEVDEGQERGFWIESDPVKYPGQWRVHGNRIERLVSMSNWDFGDAHTRFRRAMGAMGISRALEERGAKEGDLVMILDEDFDFIPENRGTLFGASQGTLGDKHLSSDALEKRRSERQRQKEEGLQARQVTRPPPWKTKPGVIT